MPGTIGPLALDAASSIELAHAETDPPIAAYLLSLVDLSGRHHRFLDYPNGLVDRLRVVAGMSAREPSVQGLPPGTWTVELTPLIPAGVPDESGRIDWTEGTTFSQTVTLAPGEVTRLAVP